MKKILLIFAVFSVSQAFPKLDDYFVHPYQRGSGPYAPGPRIVGGQDAEPHQFPYQLGLYVYTATSTDFCGGSLISSNYVLTAAHCADLAVEIEVILGAHNITAEEDTQIRLSSTEFIVHEGWDRNNLVNDIALVKLPEPVEETSAIKIIDIAAGSEQYDGDAAVVAGWGRTFQTQDYVTPILKYFVSTVLSNDDCKKTDSSYDAIIKPSLVCISGAGNVGSCQGDSGGPMAVNGIQIGLVSFGSKNCTSGKPSVFTRLTEYTEWIANNSDVSLR